MRPSTITLFSAAKAVTAVVGARHKRVARGLVVKTVALVALAVLVGMAVGAARAAAVAMAAMVRAAMVASLWDWQSLDLWHRPAQRIRTLVYPAHARAPVGRVLEFPERTGRIRVASNMPAAPVPAAAKARPALRDVEYGKIFAARDICTPVPDKRRQNPFGGDNARSLLQQGRFEFVLFQKPRHFLEGSVADE